jgi:endonuclease YncB( thermonuclease family)
MRLSLWIAAPAGLALLGLVLFLPERGRDERDPLPHPRPVPAQQPTLAPANQAPTNEPPLPSPTATADDSIHVAVEDAAGDEVRFLRRKVVRVLDGDSVVLEGDEQARLIGIDTPEKDEPYSDEARNACRRRLEGKEVLLELDVEERDHYGRLLVHVWIRDPATGERSYVNGELVRAGLARAYPHEPNRTHRDELAARQEEARAGKAGIWSLPPPEAASHYLASRSGGRFHRPDCPHVAEIAERGRTARSGAERGKKPLLLMQTLADTVHARDDGTSSGSASSTPPWSRS